MKGRSNILCGGRRLRTEKPRYAVGQLTDSCSDSNADAMSSLHGASRLSGGSSEDKHAMTHGLNPKDLQAQVKVKSPLAQRRGVSTLHDISETGSNEHIVSTSNNDEKNRQARPHFKKVLPTLKHFMRK